MSQNMADGNNGRLLQLTQTLTFRANLQATALAVRRGNTQEITNETLVMLIPGSRLFLTAKLNKKCDALCG